MFTIDCVKTERMTEKTVNKMDIEDKSEVTICNGKAAYFGFFLV